MKQQISSLIDADLHSDDASQVLNVMESSHHLRATWSEYHLVGDVMRGEPVLSADFTAKVMRQLAEEPVVLAPRAQNRANATQRISNLHYPAWALAASVAAVAFVAWFVVQEMQPVQQPMMNAAQDDYLIAHQSAAPSNTAYLLETVAFEK